MTEFKQTSLDSFADWPELLARVDNDRELLEELFVLFHEELPRQWNALESEIESGHFEKIQQRAHALKGMFNNLSLKSGGALAASIEDAARAGDGQRTSEAATEFGREIEQLMPALENFLAGLNNEDPDCR